MTQVTRPVRSPEEQLRALGVPERTLERWRREIEACETPQQLERTAQNHRLEAMIIGGTRR